jgi:hypothetical protein
MKTRPEPSSEKKCLRNQVKTENASSVNTYVRRRLKRSAAIELASKCEETIHPVRISDVSLSDRSRKKKYVSCRPYQSQEALYNVHIKSTMMCAVYQKTLKYNRSVRKIARYLLPMQHLLPIDVTPSATSEKLVGRMSTLANANDHKND